MADGLYIGGTQIGLEDVASPGGAYGYVRVVGLGWGAPDTAQFLDPRPLGDGKVFRGAVPQDRKFSLSVYGHSFGSLAKGQDSWLGLVDLFRSQSGAVSIKYVRTDGTGATITRELLAIVAGELPAWTMATSGDGIRPNGNFLLTMSLIAPYPWFRNFVETTSTINLTGSGSGNVVVTRSGNRVCGVQVKVTTAGTLDGILIQDGNRSMTLTAAFGASGKGVDWYYTDPTRTSIDSGVTISAPGHLSLWAASTTFTAQSTSASASGAHVVTLKHKAVWEGP